MAKAAEATKSTREAVAPPCRKPPEFCIDNHSVPGIRIQESDDTTRLGEREREEEVDKGHGG